MAGTKNDVIVAKNADFSQAAAPNPQSSESNGLITNGQIWLGTTAVNVGGTHINVVTVTAGTGISITQSATALTFSVNGAVIGETITGDTGGALSPVAGNWNIFGTTAPSGTNPVTTAGSGNTLSINIQRSQAVAASSPTKVGLANFNSSHFSVDSSGFVSLISGGFAWTDVTTATQAMAVENGYLTDRGAGVVYTLPASASIGDEMIIVGKLGLTTITPNANQQILFGSASGAVGVTGTAVGTNVGDCCTLICITSGASCVFRAKSWAGNWTLN